jgi:deoxyribodipyrimidine photo-lyase
MPESLSILGFRLDLRLADNSALQAAIKRGSPVIPVLIHAPDEEAPWQPGAASRWRLHQALAALAIDLPSSVERKGVGGSSPPTCSLESHCSGPIGMR